VSLPIYIIILRPIFLCADMGCPSPYIAVCVSYACFFLKAH
jgi:hypothetical protein